MRPVNLIMSAFGSYLNKTVIDFEKLGEKGMYLITGDTGAGKTTIFDAITYALYGIGSGDLRSGGKSFRSKYAGYDNETYVELKFLYKDKIYVVHRNPEYERKSKRGEGIVVQKASELLIMPDGRNIVGKNQVNEEITKLIGVDERQFRQIVMLPQGNFMKFLMAETNQKHKIFSEIFKTNFYALLQEKVKETCKTTLESIVDDKKCISRSVSEIICPETSEAYSYLSEIKETFDENYVFHKDSILNKIDVIILEETEKKAVYEKELEEVNAVIEDINKKLGIEKINHSLRDTINKNNIIIENETQALSEFKIRYDNAVMAAEKISDLDIRAASIKEQYVKYEEKDRLILEYNTINDSYKVNEKEASEMFLLLENKKTEIENYSKEHQKLLISDNEEIILKTKEIELKNKSEKIKEISEIFLEYQKNEKSFKSAQDEFKLLLHEYEELKELYQKKEKLFDSAIAGILAEKLLENQMCPVCGSREHPCIAIKPLNTPTEQELEQCKEELLLKEENKNKLRDKVNRLKEKTNYLIKDITGKLVDIFDDLTFIPEEISELIKIKEKQTAELIADIHEKLEKINQKKSRIKEIEKLVEISQKEINKTIENIEKNKQKSDELKEKLIILQTQSDGIILEFENLETAKNEYEKLMADKYALQKELSEALNKYEDCKSRIITAQTAVVTAEKQLLINDISDLTALNEMLDKNKKKRNDIIETISAINHIIETNTDKKSIIVKFGESLEKKYSQYRWQKELSDLVSGNIKKLGADQITLEVRVQMIYFNKIIRKANIHLLKMTEGQYELVRALEGNDGRKKTGLNLNIYDHFIQSERDVKTLSGGESFMASLALAFGMVDEIQESAGGIQIDTMFIDEGFGSLDDDALNHAVNMLNSLIEGKRLIGIISHVSELKNRIEKQIIVTKNNYCGSKIKIEY